MTTTQQRPASATRRGASGAANGGAGAPGAGARPAARPVHRDPGSTGSWFVSIALVLVVVTASFLARPLFTTAGWAADVVIMAAAVIGAGALVRTFTGGVLWPSLASLAAFLGVLTVRMRPESIADVFVAWGRESSALVTQLASDAPPFHETTATVTGLVAIVGIIAMACDLFVFGLRGRVSAVLPVLVFPVLPVALGVVDIDLWPAVWLAAAFALYLFATGWWHQRVADDRLADAGYLVDDRGFSGWFGALTTAAAGLVLAIVASFVIPTPAGVPWLIPNPGAGLSTNRANPILDLGDDLRRDAPIDVLQYATSISEGALPYLSLVTLAELDGASSEWAPTEFTADATTSGGGPLPAPAGVSAQAPSATFGANIMVQPGVSAYLPHPGAAVAVQQLSTDYGFQASTGDLREQAGEALAQHFEYTGTVVTAGRDEIAAAGLSVPPDLQALTDVPSGAAADRIRAALDGVVDASLPPYAQAQQVQQYLVSEAFTYSETAPVNGGYDGTNLDVVAEFLDARSGYCVHFSSAMAVMGRMLGIPTRIQVGFTPGTPTSINDQGQAVYTVTSNDLHAWAELYVDGYGWVPFESTPAVGLGNLAAPDLNAEDQATEIPVPTETPEPTDAPESSPAETPEPADGSTSTESTDAGADQGGPPAWLNATTLVIALVALLALAVLAAPGVARALVRRARRGAIERSGEAPGNEADGAVTGVPAGVPDARGDAAPHAGSSGARPAAIVAWRELLDEALDHRAAVPERSVLQRQEARLAEIAATPARGGVGDSDAPDAAEIRAALERLRAAVEQTAFGRPGGAPAAIEWSDVEVVERGIRANATRAGRFRAVAVPASLPVFRMAVRWLRSLVDGVRGRGEGAPERPGGASGTAEPDVYARPAGQDRREP